MAINSSSSSMGKFLVEQIRVAASGDESPIRILYRLARGETTPQTVSCEEGWAVKAAAKDALAALGEEALPFVERSTALDGMVNE